MSSESDGIFCKWQYFLPTKFFDDKVFTDKVCLSFTNYTVTYLSKKRETNKQTNKQTNKRQWSLEIKAQLRTAICWSCETSQWNTKCRASY